MVATVKLERNLRPGDLVYEWLVLSVDEQECDYGVTGTYWSGDGVRHFVLFCSSRVQVGRDWTHHQTKLIHEGAAIFYENLLP
jgi:hypothetical protein